MSPIFPPGAIVDVSATTTVAVGEAVVVAGVQAPVPVRRLGQFRTRLQAMLATPALAVLAVPVAIPVVPIVVLAVPRRAAAPIIVATTVVATVVPITVAPTGVQ